MKIIDNSENIPVTDEKIGMRYYVGDPDHSGQSGPDTLCVASEHFTEVYINERPMLKLACTPSMLAEMVLGRLYTEGMIKSAEDIDQITVSEAGTAVKVLLRESAADDGADGHSFILDSTGSRRTGIDDLTAVFRHSEPPAPVTPIGWEHEWICSLADRFEKSTELFHATRSVHSCYLAMGPDLLYICEDIGRHNAVDKAVGCALRDGVDLRKCIIFSSGRLPTDMVAKAIRAGIPILASKTVCTDRGAELARQYGLTLICFAKKDHFVLMK